MREKPSIRVSLAACFHDRLVLPAALATFLFCVSSSAAAGDVSSFPIDEGNPSASIPSLEARDKAPLQFGYFLQDLYTRGQLALEKRDWATAAKYFEAIVEVVPDRARSFSKLCESYGHLGKRELAVLNCRKALGLEGATLIDHKRFIEMVLAGKALSPADVGSIDASIAHVREQAALLPEKEPPPRDPPKPVAPGAPPDETWRALQALKETQRERREAIMGKKQRAAFMLELETLACRLGLRLRDAARLNRCLDELKRQKADERVLLPFEWSKALIVGDRTRAATLLEQAKRLGIPPATLAAMLDEQSRAFGLVAWLKRSWIGLAVGLGAAAGLGAALLFVSRRRRLKTPDSELAAARAPAES